MGGRKKTHLNLFAVKSRNNGNADIDHVVADLVAEAAVLGMGMLINPQIRKDFYSRDDRRVDFFGHADDFVQNAVHSETHQNAVVQNLKVDVGGPGRNGVRKKVINDCHDRQFGRRFLKALGLGTQRFPDAVFNDFFEILGRLLLIKHEAAVQIIVGREIRLDRAAQTQSQKINGLQIGRVFHRHPETAIRFLAENNGSPLAGDVFG